MHAALDNTSSTNAPQGEGIFGALTLDSPSTSVVVTNNDFDAMALHQECGIPAVSLSNHSLLSPQLKSRLEKYETVYLWLNHDSISQLFAKAIVNELGAFRCVNVHKPVVQFQPSNLVRVFLFLFLFYLFSGSLLIVGVVLSFFIIIIIFLYLSLLFFSFLFFSFFVLRVRIRLSQKDTALKRSWRVRKTACGV